MKVDVWIDAQATLGIINRQALGKVRHVEVQNLWLQEATKRGKIMVPKVDSKSNMADLMTKPLSAAEIGLHLEGLGCSFGR